MRSAIVTSFDANYFEYSMVLVKSFAQNYTGTDKLDFICLVPLDLKDREEEYIERINERSKLQLSFRTSNEYEDLVAGGRYNFDRIPHITSNAMQRVFLASTLNEYDKAIYIDPDTVVVRNVQPLLNYPLRNKIIARTEYRTGLDDPDRPYFNNGVFVTDLGWWREVGLEKQMLSWLENNEPGECIEQDLMNMFMTDVLAPLPSSFNYIQEFLGHKLYRRCVPMVVHFMGVEKPWHYYSKPTFLEQAWRKIYQELFPGTNFERENESNN